MTTYQSNFQNDKCEFEVSELPILSDTSVLPT